MSQHESDEKTHKILNNKLVSNSPKKRQKSMSSPITQIFHFFLVKISSDVLPQPQDFISSWNFAKKVKTPQVRVDLMWRQTLCRVPGGMEAKLSLDGPTCYKCSNSTLVLVLRIFFTDSMVLEIFSDGVGDFFGVRLRGDFFSLPKSARFLCFFVFLKIRLQFCQPNFVARNGRTWQQTTFL